MNRRRPGHGRPRAPRSEPSPSLSDDSDSVSSVDSEDDLPLPGNFFRSSKGKGGRSPDVWVSVTSGRRFLDYRNIPVNRRHPVYGMTGESRIRCEPRVGKEMVGFEGGRNWLGERMQRETGTQTSFTHYRATYEKLRNRELLALDYQGLPGLHRRGAALPPPVETGRVRFVNMTLRYLELGLDFGTNQRYGGSMAILHRAVMDEALLPSPSAICAGLGLGASIFTDRLQSVGGCVARRVLEPLGGLPFPHPARVLMETTVGKDLPRGAYHVSGKYKDKAIRLQVLSYEHGPTWSRRVCMFCPELESYLVKYANQRRRTTALLAALHGRAVVWAKDRNVSDQDFVPFEASTIMKAFNSLPEGGLSQLQTREAEVAIEMLNSIGETPLDNRTWSVTRLLTRDIGILASVLESWRYWCSPAPIVPQARAKEYFL